MTDFGWSRYFFTPVYIGQNYLTTNNFGSEMFLFLSYAGSLIFLPEKLQHLRLPRERVGLCRRAAFRERVERLSTNPGKRFEACPSTKTYT
jgi:hypothetical protein